MTKIEDHVLMDLQRAVKALDTLPNEISVEGIDRSMPVAEVAGILGQLVRFLELEIELANVNQAKTYIERSRVAIMAGDLEAARKFNERARRLMNPVGF